MQKNLNGKIIAIIAILLVFLYGIFGIPHGSFKQTLTDRIHLGLDLRGGTHIVLQVHTAEAVAANSDNDLVRAQAAVTKAAPTAKATKPEPMDVLTRFYDRVRPNPLGWGAVAPRAWPKTSGS